MIVTVTLVNHALLKEAGSTAGPTSMLMVGDGDNHIVCRQRIRWPQTSLAVPMYLYGSLRSHSHYSQRLSADGYRDVLSQDHCASSQYLR